MYKSKDPRSPSGSDGNRKWVFLAQLTRGDFNSEERKENQARGVLQMHQSLESRFRGRLRAQRIGWTRVRRVHQLDTHRSSSKSGEDFIRVFRKEWLGRDRNPEEREDDRKRGVLRVQESAESGLPGRFLVIHIKRRFYRLQFSAVGYLSVQPASCRWCIKEDTCYTPVNTLYFEYKIKCMFIISAVNEA